MSMGPVPSTTGNSESNGKFSKPHEHTTNLIVCGWCSNCCCSIRSNFFLFICWASQFTFRVASEGIPTTTGTTPPASLLLKTIRIVRDDTDTDTHTHTHFLVDLKFAIAIGVSAVFLTLLFVMSFLKFLRFEMRRKRAPDGLVAAVDDDGDGDGNASVKRFTWQEMEGLTMNFSRDIGSGGFSTVYLAQFPDSSLGAIKIQSSSERLNRVYKQELEILLRLRHDNIVKLLGYCDDRAPDGGVLVFEYVPNGTLQEKLHGSSGGATGGKGSVLLWKSRMAIAFQLAQAMEYLHEKCTPQIVHGDIKSSNILLDEQLNCKLCDFGSAKMGFSSTVLPLLSSSSTMMKNRMMLGSLGYTDPHHLRTGIASKKNDVYSFGVIVLELITGIEAFCSVRGERLTSIAGPMLRDATVKVAAMVDSRLDGGFDLEEAKAMASISAMCLCDSPSLRPSASDILRTMRDKIPSISSFLFTSTACTKDSNENFTLQFISS